MQKGLDNRSLCDTLIYDKLLKALALSDGDGDVKEPAVTNMSKKIVLSKDIVEKYNIAYPTLTHYTNLGFFTVVGRKGNKRLYDEEEVKRCLMQVRELRKQGYPLRLIREKIKPLRSQVV